MSRAPISGCLGEKRLLLEIACFFRVTRVQQLLCVGPRDREFATVLNPLASLPQSWKARFVYTAEISLYRGQTTGEPLAVSLSL